MADEELVRYAVAGGVATVTLDSPHNRNALSMALTGQVVEAVGAALADPAVRVVVVTHTGPVFCSGADLKETAAARVAGQVPISRLPELLETLWTAPKPVVARVAGPARAGGLGLIAACDIAVCAEDATFAFTEVRLGVIPAVISAVVLRRLTPRAAAELYLTGTTFTGVRAAEVGLVTAAVPAEALDGALAGYVDTLVRGAPGALAGAKELLRAYTVGPELGPELARLAEISVGYFLSDEGREGVTAFAERRDPAWLPARQP